MLELEAQAQSTNPLGGWAGTTGDALGSEESAEAITSSELLVPAAEVSGATCSRQVCKVWIRLGGSPC